MGVKLEDFKRRNDKCQDFYYQCIAEENQDTCAGPLFKISNHVGYSNLKVHSINHVNIQCRTRLGKCINRDLCLQSVGEFFERNSKFATWVSRLKY